MKELLDSLHSKILKSKFAEEVTEAEIEALVKAKELTNDGWIPCSERLPQRGTRVLVTFKTESGSMGIEDCWYSSSECFKTYKDFELMSQYIEIVAWRELPSPYKPKGEK